MTAATEPRLGFYRDGDMVSCWNARELKPKLSADWVLYRLADGSAHRLFLVGSEKYRQYVQEAAQRNQRDALREFDDWSDEDEE